MKSFKIAVYPGDGIGVEVIEAATRILAAAMMLDWLGLVQAAGMIRQAVEQTLRDVTSRRIWAVTSRPAR